MHRISSGNWGYLGGLIRFLLQLLFTECMLCSFLPHLPLGGYAAAGVVCWLLGCAACGILRWYSDQSTLRYYLTGQLVFYGCCLIDFLNLITVKLCLLPRREGNAGDGILLLFFLAGYWILSELSQLLIPVAIGLFRKTNQNP